MAVTVGIVGAAGRMGRMLMETVTADDATTLAQCMDRRAQVITLSGGLDVAVLEDVSAVCDTADVVIDFTLPIATESNLAAAVKSGTPYVLGTTGLTADQDAKVAEAAQQIPIMYAANYSLGVNLLAQLVKQAAASLPDLDWDIEVVESHHNQKVDAPSGTALMLGRAAAEGRKVALTDVQKLSREGQTGVRPVGEIGFATLRGGDVAGEHTATFFGAQERIELGHRATSRAIFARGAVHAAKWLAAKDAPGLYDMSDVLGLG